MAAIKTWNGSAWVSHSNWKRGKIWNGSAWVKVKPRVWTGVGWGIVSVPQSRTITVGTASVQGNKFAPSTNYYGYGTGNLIYGSISSDSLQLWEDGVIVSLSWTDYFQQILLHVTATNPANSGFTTMKIGSTSFTRTAASYNNYTTSHSWAWNSITTNPFSAVGTNTTIDWT